MNFFQFAQNNWYIVLFVGAILTFSFVFNRRQISQMKSRGNDFIARHPQAAKVYLTRKGLIFAEVVNVYTVNGEEPAQFTKGRTMGFYVLPGKNTVQISYTYTRPGIFYKTVSESTDVVEKVLETESYKSYVLGFDRKEKSFTFENTPE